VTAKHREDRAGELFAAGKVDAAVLTWRRQYVAKPGGVLFPYGSLEGSTYLVSVTYINKKFYDGLPSEFRSLISEVAREAGRIERADTVELNEKCKRRLVSQGVGAVELSDEARARFEEALRPAYAKTLNALVGTSLIGKIRGASDDARVTTNP
jgi:TRAP-type C4-dicarboxylate transport system substrate-binding protein